jgi:hypothetical protein
MVRELGVPAGAETAVESRHLLERMVDYMIGQGVRQFLDLGSGLPDRANTHQIAHRVAPEARDVYVDKDPLVSTHAAALMAGPSVVPLRADLGVPEQVLNDTQVRDLIDFGQPVGIMFMCVLHCLWIRKTRGGVVGQFRDAAAAGSYLALSHMTGEAHLEAAAGLFRISQQLHWDTPLISRDRTGIVRFFDGFTLVEPGLVAPAQWRPDLDNPAPRPPRSGWRRRTRPQADLPRTACRRSRGRGGTCAESASRISPDEQHLPAAAVGSILKRREAVRSRQRGRGAALRRCWRQGGCAGRGRGGRNAMRSPCRSVSVWTDAR